MLQNSCIIIWENDLGTGNWIYNYPYAAKVGIDT